MNEKYLVSITVKYGHDNTKYEVTEYNNCTNCFENYCVNHLNAELQAFYDKCVSEGYAINYNNGDIYYSF